MKRLTAFLELLREQGYSLNYINQLRGEKQNVHFYTIEKDGKFAEIIFRTFNDSDGFTEFVTPNTNNIGESIRNIETVLFGDKKDTSETHEKYDRDQLLTIAENMKRHGGSFVRNLAECIYKADQENTEKLVNTFPEYFEKYLKS